MVEAPSEGEAAQFAGELADAVTALAANDMCPSAPAVGSLHCNQRSLRRSL
jgi:hypothetical protein